MIGILGGTFDPVHNTHIALACEAYQQLALNKVLLIPNGTPPHRNPSQASNDDRVNMLKLATAAYPFLEINSIEIERQNISYTIDTLKALYLHYGRTCFLMGSDAFAKLHTWHEHDRLKNYAHIVVAERPNHPLPHLPKATSTLLKSATNSLTAKLVLPPSNTSATQIRQHGQHGDLNPAVKTYINQHSLYR